MTKRMLIDATDPAEVRVVVLNRSRVEEFDHEIKSKAQLKGNIYLAKVTRVEPSLQAAFVDYGGNRHGFLPFSEIHPDYYRIPVADREALLAEEAALKATPYDDEVDDSDIDDPLADRDEPVFVEEPEPFLDEAGLAAVIDEDSAPPREDAEFDGPDDDERNGSPDRRARYDEPEEEGPEEEDREEDDETRSDLSAADEDSDEDEDEDSDEDDDDDDDGSPDDGTPSRGGRAMPHVVEGGEHRSTLPEDAEAPRDGVESSEPGTPDGESLTASAAKRETEETADLDSPAQENDEGSSEVDDGDADRSGDRPDGEPSDGELNAGDATDEESSADGDDAGTRRQGRRQSQRRGRRERGHRVATASEGEGEASVDTVGGDDIEDAARRRAKLLRRYKIQEVVKRGQVMLVQVAKEERGNKGAALTTYLSLPGRYCVLMPNTARGGGISRKIGSAADRRRLKTVLGDLSIPDGMAVIVRTAGSERSKAEIKRDYEYMMRLWSEIRETTLSSQAPALIYEEGNLIKRAIRDLYTSDTEEILVEGEDAYKAAKAFMKSLMPSHAKKVQLYKEPSVPLFLKHQVESQLGGMFDTTVQLKSGGYIVINVTEALVAIDVNSGKATRERHIEETALKTNLEAADEVARQLRLRDLAGLIVIDFIDMEESRHNRDVERRLKEAMKSDRARIQLGRISPFGLLELSRQRLRPSLVETATVLCPHCAGTGRIYSAETAALHLLRSLAEDGMRRPGGEIVATVGTKVALFLLNQKRDQLSDIEARFDFKLTLEVDDRLHGLEHRIERHGPREQRHEGRSERSRDSRRSERSEEREETESASPGDGRGDGRAEGRSESRGEGRSESRSDRRGRGRGREERGRDDRRRREEPRPAAAAEEAADDPQPLQAADAPPSPQSAAGDDEENRGRRRRRRGKRGGRRRGRRSDDQVEQSAEGGEQADRPDEADGDESAPAAHAETAGDADQGTGDEAAGEEKAAPAASGRGRRRSRRPSATSRPTVEPTANGDAPAAGEASGDAAEASAEPKEEAPGPQHSAREQSRVADGPASEAATDSAGQDQADHPKSESPKAEEQEPDEREPDEREPATAGDDSGAMTEPDPDQPKRRGWWNRLVR